MFYKGKDIRLNQLKLQQRELMVKGRLDYLNDFLKSNKKEKKISIKTILFL